MDKIQENAIIKFKNKKLVHNLRQKEVFNRMRNSINYTTSILFSNKYRFCSMFYKVFGDFIVKKFKRVVLVWSPMFFSKANVEISVTKNLKNVIYDLFVHHYLSGCGDGGLNNFVQLAYFFSDSVKLLNKVEDNFLTSFSKANIARPNYNSEMFLSQCFADRSIMNILSYNLLLVTKMRAFFSFRKDFFINFFVMLRRKFLVNQKLGAKAPRYRAIRFRKKFSGRRRAIRRFRARLSPFSPYLNL